jgi:hypothetical protein
VSNPGAGRGPASRQVNFQTVPKGEVLGTYDTYLEAQERVDHLAKADFPVGKVSIVGNDLKSVERVTRKLSWSRAALEGAASGAWFGLFIGLLVGLFTTGPEWLGLVIGGLLIGALWGAVFGYLAHRSTRGQRDFASTRGLAAGRYDLMVADAHAARARTLLGDAK